MGVANFSVRASRTLYAQMERRVIGCTMRFFDVTPMGTILNRFSKDIVDTDEGLATSLMWLTMTWLRVCSIICVIAVVQPIFVPAVVPLLMLYYAIRAFYRSTSRELQRIESMSRSPVYSAFSQIVEVRRPLRPFWRPF